MTALATRHAGIVLLLTLNTGACAVTTSAMNGDSAVGQDVPPDAVTSDVPAIDSPAPDVSRPDVVAVDVARADVAVDVSFDDVAADVSDGDAGACAVVELPPTPTCGTLCGNGQVDTCEQCQPCFGGGGGGPPPPRDAGVCCTRVPEQCDGPSLSGATCQSLGYTGGTLGCNGGCFYDRRRCDPCAPTGSRGHCGNAPVETRNPEDLALATRGGVVALAWVERTSPTATRVDVALLDADLRARHTLPCIGIERARRVALAPIGDGFLLAAETPDGTRLARIFPDGRTDLGGSFLPGESAPLVAPGPDGGALLVSVDPSGVVRARRVNSSGAVSRTAATLWSEVTEPQYGSAAFTGDGWLVAMRARDVEVVRVGIDLSVGAHHRPAGSDTEYPQVVWDGSRAAMTWSSFGGPISVRIAELTRDGALAGPVRTLASPVSATRYFNAAPMAVVYSDLAVLVGTHTGATGQSGRLDLLRENAQPLMRAPSVNPVTGGGEWSSHYRVAPLTGSAVVAAWIGVGTSRIAVARLIP